MFLEDYEEEMEISEEEERETPSEIVFEAETPKNLKPCILLSVSYSRKKKAVLCQLYDDESGKIYFWYDNTGHKPYCLTDVSQDEIIKNNHVINHKGFEKIDFVNKYDLLRDRTVRMTKIVAKDPLSIGGRKNSIRELLSKAWEAKIKYHECYIYDAQLIPGMFYKIEDGNLIPYLPHQNLNEKILSLFTDEDEQVRELALKYIPIFQTPVPEIKRLALDIEVYTSTPNRIPDPREANDPVSCIALVGSDGLKRVLIFEYGELKMDKQNFNLPKDVKLEFYNNERKLIEEVFKTILNYAVLITFNGDNFDLKYLWHRARKLGIPDKQIPIYLTKDAAMLAVGVHLDLYKFFHNKSIQVYAFMQKYKENTLDAIAEALLGEKKIQINKYPSEMTPYELASYCYKDAELTYNLTTFNSSLVMKLIVLFMRISRMPMEDVCRLGISKWIQSLLYAIHREKNYLIPLPEEILAIKGKTVTQAVIKGKKYKGAIVLEPTPGIYFSVAVLDFASLYPSIITRWNLSYETINCSHSECIENKVPGTTHWICRKRKGIISSIIALFRDIRVKWYKPMSKNTELPKPERDWYNIVQQALKVFLNASYGVFGAENFSFYCPSMAESTTAIARYAIMSTLNYAKEIGMTIIYGDTDSLFIHQPTQEQIELLLKWSYQNLGIDLDLDKRYRYVTFSKLKKNYFGILEDGNYDIKGLVGKKRNTPEFLKKAFMEVIIALSHVQNKKDFEEAQYKIKKIIQECYNNLRDRKYSLVDLSFRVMLSKAINHYVKTTPQHVKAAKLLQKFGVEIRSGDIISYVKVSGPIGVKPIRLSSIIDVDIEKYVEHMKTTFGQIMDALGLNFDEVIGIKTLDNFS
jgi:DNA polymerase I